MGWPRGVVEAGAELGALLGEIPAAERGYDGEGCVGGGGVTADMCPLSFEPCPHSI